MKDVVKPKRPMVLEFLLKDVPVEKRNQYSPTVCAYCGAKLLTLPFVKEAITKPLKFNSACIDCFTERYTITPEEKGPGPRG